MDRERVLGMATDLGSRTSHTAIMARSLNIPAVVGLHDISEQLETGDEVLVDGYNGLLICNPTPETLWHYGELESQERTGGARADRAARNEIDDARWPAHRALGQHRTAQRVTGGRG